MSVTIHAVGERAGVSPSTVSRALNTPCLVRMETRRRVEEAAASLGSRPNRVACGLITGRIGMVGLVVPDIANPYYPTLVRAADHAAHASSLALLLADTNERPDVEEELLRDMGRLVDGIILCSSRMSSEQIAEIGASGGRWPFVSVNRPMAGASSVVLDSATGMRQALRHLACQGHTRVAYAAGPERAWANGQRLRGLDVAARLAVQVVLIPTAAPRFEGGEEVVDQVLRAGVTAVFAYNDLVGLVLLSGLRARGVPVPDALSVVGFDDIFAARMVSPALTTVAMPSDEAGRRAMELLAKQLAASGNRSQRVKIPTSLIVRDSTGVAAGSSLGRSPPLPAGLATEHAGEAADERMRVGIPDRRDGEEQVRWIASFHGGNCCS